jgi:hypothetical protein
MDQGRCPCNGLVTLGVSDREAGGFASVRSGVLENPPVDGAGELRQRLALVDDLVEPRPEQVVLATVSFGGRPPVRPARFAAASPARVRSRMRARSNSASALNM